MLLTYVMIHCKQKWLMYITINVPEYVDSIQGDPRNLGFLEFHALGVGIVSKNVTKNVCDALQVVPGSYVNKN